MITNTYTILWAIFLVMLILVVYLNKKEKDKNKFSFQNFGVVDVPYVTIDIQGKQFNMIVDTACGVSLIRDRYLVESCVHYEMAQRHAQLTALTDESVDTESVYIGFILNNEYVKETFFVYHEETGFSDFEEKYGITIHGLLGVEFLDKHNCKVDFKTHKLVFP